MATTNAPFHRLLSFFGNRSSYPNSQTITFLDSLRGDLSLGLNLPLALLLAFTRHIIFRNVPYSLNIHVPTVRTSRILCGGPNACPELKEDRRYSVGQLWSMFGKEGWVARGDAVGLWILAKGNDGRVSGKEVREFQKGEVMEGIAERRRSREDVLPFWRGGPFIVSAHSWAVRKLFGVEVYSEGAKRA